MRIMYNFFGKQFAKGQLCSSLGGRAKQSAHRCFLFESRDSRLSLVQRHKNGKPNGKQWRLRRHGQEAFNSFLQSMLGPRAWLWPVTIGESSEDRCGYHQSKFWRVTLFEQQSTPVWAKPEPTSQRLSKKKRRWCRKRFCATLRLRSRQSDWKRKIPQTAKDLPTTRMTAC